MKDEHEKKPYIAPTIEVIEIHCQTNLLHCSKGGCMEEMGQAERVKEFWA